MALGARGRRAAGFTLTELMVASAIFLVVMTGALVVHFFGLRYMHYTKAKLGASDEARSAISKMVAEVRSAKILRVGNGNLSGFTPVEDGQLIAGSALQIHLTTNTNAFVRYYWDSSDRKLKRTTNGASAALVVANAISNAVVFTAEDSQGNALTNAQNNRVIHMVLEFYQLAYPSVAIGPGGIFDYYQLNTRMTRRALE